jgi:hypothetical protein
MADDDLRKIDEELGRVRERLEALIKERVELVKKAGKDRDAPSYVVLRQAAFVGVGGNGTVTVSGTTHIINSNTLTCYLYAESNGATIASLAAQGAANPGRWTCTFPNVTYPSNGDMYVVVATGDNNYSDKGYVDDVSN